MEIFATKKGIIAVKNPVRIQILEALQKSDCTFEELVECVQKAKSTVSVHLEKMQKDGLISSSLDKKDKRKKIYRCIATYIGTTTASKYELTEQIKEDIRLNVSEMNRFLNAIRELKTGDHICFLYETEEERNKALVPYFEEALNKNEQCLYITFGEQAKAKKVLDLNSKRLDVIIQKNFNPENLLALIKRELELALDKGYSGLRIAVEVAENNLNKLLEYESKLNLYLPSSKALLICQYSRNKFPPQVLLEILKMHAFVIAMDTICRNFYYIPSKGGEEELNNYLFNLMEIEKLHNQKPFNYMRSLFRAMRYITQAIGIDIKPVLKLTGREVGRELAGLMHATEPIALIKEIASFWESNKMGKLTILKSQPPIEIIIENCYECGGMPNVGTTLCALDEGLISAILDEKLGVKSTVREKECWGTGYNHCRFTIEW
ncbi:MAG: MEDS domain-containing protein [Methanocellales archaeon]